MGHMPDIEAEPESKRRRIAFTVCVAVFGLGIGLGFFALPSLIFGWFEGGERQIHRVHDIAWGITGGLIISVGFLAQLRRPERKVAAMQQVVLGVIAYFLAAILASDYDSEVLLGTLIFVAACAIAIRLHPAQGELFRHDEGYSRVMLAVALVAAVPYFVFALRMASYQRLGLPSDPHVELHHWSGMAAMALSLILVALLASVRTRGWWIPAWCAGLGSVVYGLASVLFAKYPGTDVPYPGSEGVIWGILAIVWGVAFFGATEWEVRRVESPPETLQ
ncbi:MAG: hypothetical protein WD276_09605 [Actinomycetota bacterium]